MVRKTCEPKFHFLPAFIFQCSVRLAQFRLQTCNFFSSSFQFFFAVSQCAYTILYTDTISNQKKDETLSFALSNSTCQLCRKPSLCKRAFLIRCVFSLHIRLASAGFKLTCYQCEKCTTLILIKFCETQTRLLAGSLVCVWSDSVWKIE